ncbi:MAG: ABC transporter substrate-binding protein, partial [Chloroflexota bacterium]
MASTSDRVKVYLETRMDRLTLLKTAGLAVAAFGVGSCAGPPATTQPSPAPKAESTVGPAAGPTATAPAVIKKRTIRIASAESGGAKETMDPAFSAVDTDGARTCMVYNRLVRPNSSFRVQPELAESWEANEKGDVWTFHLRKGVKFHDGCDFTARDVIYTYRRLLDPATASPGAAFLSALDANGIEKADDYTVRFKLPSPFADLPLAITTRHTFIIPEGSKGEELRVKGVGTGPFKQEEFAPGGAKSLFTKNDNYWEPGLPKADAIEFRSITEPTSRVSALQADQSDLALEVDAAGLATLKANKDIKVITERTPFVMDLAMWCDTSPFDDVRVRMAMKLVGDREAMVKTVLPGYGDVGDDCTVAPWVEYARTDPPKKQDNNKAKALLSEAGHRNGLEVELYTAEASPGMVRMAQVYKEMAAMAGINVTINQSPAETYWSEVWRKKPFVCGTWSGRPADEALVTPYLSTAKWNDTHWYRPEFDKLILDARKTLDKAKRTELYQTAQCMVAEDGGMIVPIFQDALA